MKKLHHLESQICKMMQQMQLMEQFEKKREVRVKKKKLNKQKLIKQITKKLESKFSVQKPPWRPVMHNDKIPRYEDIRLAGRNALGNN